MVDIAGVIFKVGGWSKNTGMSSVFSGISKCN